FFFFFQAEDGIRDGHVTGVQTCALPILAGAIASFGQAKPGVSFIGASGETDAWFRLPKAGNCACLDEGKGRFEEYTIFPGGGTRSEERRVGKECGEGRYAWTGGR